MPDLNRTFAALSDGTRRAIVARLASGEAPLSDLAEPFEMSQTAVSKHVRVLERAGARDAVLFPCLHRACCASCAAAAAAAACAGAAAGTRSGRVARRAGTSPDARPVTSVSARAKPSTR